MSDQGRQPPSEPKCPIPFLQRGAKQEALSAALKTQTQGQHDEAEGHGLHAVLFGSHGVEAAREAYARLLGQHLLIQEAFDPLLAQEAGAGRWGGLVREYHSHLAALRDDCEVMGVTADMLQPLPSTLRFIQRIEAMGDGDSFGLLGVFYVFEGSTNGGTIIAMRVKDLLGFEGEAGTRFINPHGAQVRPRWVRWREDVDALVLTDQQRAAAIAGAREAFSLSHAVLGDVARAMTTPIGGKPQGLALPIKAAAKSL